MRRISVGRSFCNWGSIFLTFFLHTGVALSSLIYLGYFVEVGNFGCQVYANNEFSKILLTEGTNAAKGGKSMKDAVGLALVYTLKLFLIPTDIFVATEPTMGLKLPLVYWTLQPGKEKEMQRLQQTLPSISVKVSSSGRPLLGMNGEERGPPGPWSSLTEWGTKV